MKLAIMPLVVMLSILGCLSPAEPDGVEKSVRAHSVEAESATVFSVGLEEDLVDARKLSVSFEGGSLLFHSNEIKEEIRTDIGCVSLNSRLRSFYYSNEEVASFPISSHSDCGEETTLFVVRLGLSINSSLFPEEYSDQPTFRCCFSRAQTESVYAPEPSGIWRQAQHFMAAQGSEISNVIIVSLRLPGEQEIRQPVFLAININHDAVAAFCPVFMHTGTSVNERADALTRKSIAACLALEKLAKPTSFMSSRRSR